MKVMRLQKQNFLKSLLLDFDLLCNMLIFPSVLLHEAYHYVMARLLGVRVVSVAFLKRGRFPSSFVEMQSSSRFKVGVVQLAPFVFGLPLVFLFYPYVKGLVPFILFMILLLSVAIGNVDLFTGTVNLLLALYKKMV